MGLRASFSGGLAIGLAATLAGAALVPDSRADDRPKDVRLLVACDATTRAQVLSALRGLDVTVHDLATMEVVPLPGRPTRLTPASLTNAFEVWREWFAVVEAVRKAAGADRTLTVGKLTVQPSGTVVSGYASDADTLAALETALREDARLGSRRPERGPILRDPRSGILHWELTVATPPIERVPEAPRGSEEPSPRSLLGAVQSAGGNVRSMSAVEVEPTPAGERRSMVVQLASGDPVAVAHVLERVAALPGVVITGVTWADTQGGASVNFQVTVTVPR